MLIIGCDFRPGFQRVAVLDRQAGECQEKRLRHREEAEGFYRPLAGQEVRAGESIPDRGVFEGMDYAETNSSSGVMADSVIRAGSADALTA
jgi:hypothetical protein